MASLIRQSLAPVKARLVQVIEEASKLNKLPPDELACQISTVRSVKVKLEKYGETYQRKYSEWLQAASGEEEELKRIQEDLKAHQEITSYTDDALICMTVIIEHSERQERQEMMRRKLDQLQLSPLAQGDVKMQPNGAPEVSQKTVKLPKLELPKFSGEILQWQSFWDTFNSAVNSNLSLSSIDKMSYLRAQLSGDAHLAISGLAATADNYKLAIKLLTERYGNKDIVVDVHYAALSALPAAHSQRDLRAIFDKVEQHVNSLEALNEDVTGRHMVVIVKSKLPPSLVVQLEKDRTGGDWNGDEWRKRIRQHLTICESVYQNPQSAQASFSYSPTDSSKFGKFNKAYRNHRTVQPSTTSSLGAGATVSSGNKTNRQAGVDQYRRGANQRGTPPNCAFCGQGHWSEQCPTYLTAQVRMQQLRNKRLCNKCLHQGHAGPCPRSKPCFHCGQLNHHRSICFHKFGRSVPLTMNHPPRMANAQAASHMAVQPAAFPVPEHACNQISAPTASLAAVGEMVTLQTATTTVRAPSSENGAWVRLFLDCGSQRSYVTEELARQLKLKPISTQWLQVFTFGSTERRRIKTCFAKIQIELLNGSLFEITVNIVPVITGNLHRTPIQLDRFGELIKQFPLADSIPQSSEFMNAQILIGNDYYFDFISQERITLSDGLFLIGSKLGWILSGRTMPEGQVQLPTTVMATAVFMNSSSDPTFVVEDESAVNTFDITKFWDLDTIGIKERVCDREDELALHRFNDTIKYEGNRYFVTWPWKENHADLPTNYHLSLGRLNSLLNRFKGNPDLASQYNAIIQQQEQKGIIERVQEISSYPETQKHYIPHHAVVTPDKATTKVRIVYDGSAKSRKGNPSINDCLHRGPVILDDVCHLLIRFRLNPIALTADIEKAFLQVGLQVEERDVTRFLWLKDPSKLTTGNNLQVYRFARVPFGIISSPFLLGATITHHLKEQGGPTATDILQSMYVDNLITGVASTEEAKAYYTTAKNLFGSASMNIREWASNDVEFLESLAQSDRATGPHNKVLGVAWDTEKDVLSIRSSSPPEPAELTKRSILKYMASVFDPLGLFCPTVLQGKLFLQKLWKEKVDWDDSVPEHLITQWVTISAAIGPVGAYQIPRFIGSRNTVVKQELHCFSDASQSAYGTCIYLRLIQGDSATTNLLFAKSRLAPLQGMTLPRLELLAVQIGTTCMKFVSGGLPFKVEDQYLWTDSQCVLHWLNSDKPLTTFVKNRIKQIRSHEGIKFRYVPTSENPADHCSRGKSATELANDCLWWHGPKWLSETGQDCWPEINFLSTVSKSSEEEVLYSVSSVVQEKIEMEAPPFGIQLEKYSSLMKLLRVTSWVARFISRLKSSVQEKKLKGTKERNINQLSLTADVVTQSMLLWIQYIQKKHYSEVLRAIEQKKRHLLCHQLDLFLDTDGLLKCGGRLKHADLSDSAKHPVLLPKGEKFTKLIIERAHNQLYHVGVSQTLAHIRQEYWIPAGRSMVNQVIKSCLNCKKIDGGPYRLPQMPPLPHSRVQVNPAFQTTGLDYLGPLYVKEHSNQEMKKVWICLFTCLTTRAVHLEVVEDLSGAQFLLCLQRFVARRGKPNRIISDNATQFKLVQSSLQRIWKSVLEDPAVTSYTSNRGITWQYIVERAPWQGGFYKRLVMIIKQCLKKTLGHLRLTLVQLQTVVTEVEAILNNRPLTYVGSDFSSGQAITPAHFLTLNPPLGFQTGPTEDPNDPDYIDKQSNKATILQTWKKGQQHLEQFWYHWKTQYLLSLREKHQLHVKQPRHCSHLDPQVGDIVLVRQAGPRGIWKLAKITALNESSDGQIRSAHITLSTGLSLRRSLADLFPLEVRDEAKMDEETNEEGTGEEKDGMHDKNENSAIIESKPESAPAPSCRPQRKAAKQATVAITDQMKKEEESDDEAVPVKASRKKSVTGKFKSNLLLVSLAVLCLMNGFHCTSALQPLICGAEEAKLSIDLSLNQQCKNRNSITKEKPKDVNVSLYKKNIAKTTSVAWECSKTETTLMAWTQFAKAGWDKNKVIRNLPVSTEECQEMVSANRCSEGYLLGNEEVALTTHDASYPYTTGNAWDCCKWVNITFTNCQRVKGKVYMTFGGHMESNLGNVVHCKYEKESCDLANQERLIWTKSEEAQCEYVSWMNMEGHMWKGKFLNQERTFALTWDPAEAKQVKVCSGKTATLTDQEIPMTSTQKKSHSKRQYEPLDPELQALETRLSDYFNKELANRFLETCKTIEIMQEMDLIFAHHEPTLVARKILGEELIMARLNGKILDVWPCVPVDSFSTLPMKGENCFSAIPMNFSLKGQARMGYYDVKTRIIFQKAELVDCHLIEEMHFTDEQDKVLLYQASTGSINPFNGTILKHPLYTNNFTIFADFKEVLHKPITMYNLEEIRAQTSLNDLYDFIDKHEKILKALAQTGQSQSTNEDVKKILSTLQQWTPWGWMSTVVLKIKDIWMCICCALVTIYIFYQLKLLIGLPMKFIRCNPGHVPPPEENLGPQPSLHPRASLS